ncbi:MAG: RING finger protein [Anaerolineae bacterium]
MIRATLVDKHSPFLGEECALCKLPLAPGDEIVICPEDGSRHHVPCWHANGDRCTAYGCVGNGPVITSGNPGHARREAAVPPTDEPQPEWRMSRTRSVGCAQSCLFLSISVAILLFAIGCFGLWAIADYIMLEVLDWPYRAPLSGSIMPIRIAMEALAFLPIRL